MIFEFRLMTHLVSDNVKGLKVAVGAISRIARNYKEEKEDKGMLL